MPCLWKQRGKEERVKWGLELCKAYKLTALPVVVTFHSGNLPIVAKDYREKYPEKLLLIAGDNDHQKPGDKNVGVLKRKRLLICLGATYCLLLHRKKREATGMIW